MGSLRMLEKIHAKKLPSQEVKKVFMPTALEIKNRNEGNMHEFTNVPFVGLVDVLIKCLPIKRRSTETHSTTTCIFLFKMM